MTDQEARATRAPEEAQAEARVGRLRTPKQERRLAAAVQAAGAEALRRWPEGEGSLSHQQRMAIRRDAFVKGALWMRAYQATPKGGGR